MKSRRSKHFRALFAALPQDIQEQAKEAYKLFQTDPSHPGLNFKLIEAKHKHRYYSARIGLHYRVIGKMQPDGSIFWGWIGTHSEYDKLIPRL
jgi:mRNA-degrading endonuclease HigB of HigAB toxin-antitoxin module